MTSYCGEEIALVEQNGKCNRTSGIIGCRYEPTVITETFREACGSYRIANEKFRDLNCKCSLELEDDMLVLDIEALNVKIRSCLKVMDENLAITQGFGRNARQAVMLRKGKGGIYFTYSGIVFKKI